MTETVFVKLGGSLITDKAGIEQVREKTLQRIAREIAHALSDNVGLRLVLGHGSGSFGHVAAAEHQTRKGVTSVAGWHGFARVSDAASRLNRLVVGALLAEGVAAIGLQPSASAHCQRGHLDSLAVGPIRMALDARLVPVIYGDVAFDDAWGGTIISTEEVMIFLAASLRPSWLLLAGETEGVFDGDSQVVAHITHTNFDKLAPAIVGSRGTDVTGGMASKVSGMLGLVEQFPNLRVRVFSGLGDGNLYRLLSAPDQPIGTEISA